MAAFATAPAVYAPHSPAAPCRRADDEADTAKCVCMSMQRAGLVPPGMPPALPGQQLPGAPLGPPPPPMLAEKLKVGRMQAQVPWD